MSFFSRRFFILAVFVIFVGMCPESRARAAIGADLHQFREGVSTDKEFFAAYPKADARIYRLAPGEEWVTFDLDNPAVTSRTVTVHFREGVLQGWAFDDREEMAREYAGEFASGNIIARYGKVSTALQNVLARLPLDVFLKVTDRRRPIVFLDYYTTGIARFARSNEFFFLDDEPHAFQDGFYVIQLGDGLNAADDVRAVEGILYHEIAHRVLEHLHSNTPTCDKEREANRLVKKWGFEDEFLAAKGEMGSHSKADSPCYEEPK